VDLFDLVTGQNIKHISATGTPGRVISSPDGKRAAAEYVSAGVSLIDLVDCPASGLKFIQSTIPNQDMVFTPDSTYLITDWSSTAGPHGVAAYDTLQGDKVLDDAHSTPAAVGIVLAVDGTSNYVFATSAAPQSGQVFMTVYQLATPHASQCSLQQVPSNAFGVTISAGRATIGFQNIFPIKTWIVDPGTCQVFSRT